MADNNINFNLISLDGLGEFGKTLIEKLSNAVGWIATKGSPNRIALQTYIEGIQNSDYDPLLKAAMISGAQKTITEYANQCNVVQFAINNLHKNARPQEIDNDWISQLMDKARLVSDSDFQRIWGRILAEECNAPGSIPRSLLHTLDRMDRKDAERFTALCSFSVLTRDNDSPTFSPIIIQKYLSEYYSGKGITFDALIDLQALGLIEVSVGPFKNEFCVYCSSESSKLHEVLYFDKQFIIPDDIEELPVGNVIFTKTGQALCRAIHPEQQDDFFNKYCIPYWEEKFSEIRRK